MALFVILIIAAAAGFALGYSVTKRKVIARSYSRDLRSKLDKAKASFKEIDDYAKMIVRTNLELSKAEDELSKKVEGLSLLHGLGKTISATFNISELLKFVTDALVFKMDYEKSVVFLVDVKKRIVSTKVSCGFTEEELRRLNLMANDIIFQYLINKPIVVNSTRDRSQVSQKLAGAFGVNSIIAIPLVVKDQTEGIIVVGKDMPYGELTAADLEMVSILASQVAIAIENALLYETLERKVDERTYQLKEAQTQLIQAAKMNAVGQLGAGIAHELNNPLGGILGYAQLMLHKLDAPGFGAEEGKSCRRYLEFIEKETARCKEIVQHLLKFSRKSSEVRKLDIRAVLEDTFSVLGNQLRLANINAKLDVDPNIKEINGNPNQLQQVFTNIIINAQQAMPNGGDLNISAYQHGGRIRLEFKDTGCGISKEHIDKIFDPFFTTKSDSKGTGLGLTVSYKIIQDHKGTIDVQSEPGKGSTFIITLPAFVPQIGTAAGKPAAQD